MPRKCLIRVDRLPSVYLEANPLKLVHEHSYLGFNMSDNLLDDCSIRKQTRCLYSRANSLLRKFSFCSAHVKLTLFRSFCTNLYCSQLWSTYTKKCLNNLRVAYNNAFRILMGYARDCSASNMFVSNSIPTFEVLRRKYIYNFRKRLDNSDNVLISTLQNSDAYLYSRHVLMYRKLMYF